MELVDTLALGASAAGLAGSSPVPGTSHEIKAQKVLALF